jgi:nicotinamidase-related amidase
MRRITVLLVVVVVLAGVAVRTFPSSGQAAGEAAVRFAVELGYDVTVVKDATADYSEQFMHAALVTNLPNYASSVVTEQEVADALLTSRELRQSPGA